LSLSRLLIFAGGLGVFKQHVFCASGLRVPRFLKINKASEHKISSDIFHGGENGAVLQEFTQDRTRKTVRE